MKILSFKDQDFKSLRGRCNQKNLFVDPIFKADSSSLVYSDALFKQKLDALNVKWLRPKVNIHI